MSDEEKIAIVRREISRRNVLRGLGLGAVVAGGAGVLAACSSSGSDDAGDSTPPSSTPTSSAPTSSAPTSSAPTSVAPGTYGDIKIQLSWIKNIEFAGEYFATENGYYTEAGFKSVELVAGPKDSADAEVLQGNVNVALSAPDATARLVLEQGAPLKIIATTYQKNPFCIMSLEEGTPIKTVADLKGKKIGCQTPNLSILEGFLKANGMTKDDIKIVDLAFDFSITTLLQGQTQGHMAYLTNEPFLAESDGKTPVTLGFADNNLPLTAETYTVTDDYLKANRDLLKAFLKAEIKGWKDAVADPAKSADLAVNKYGKDNKDLKVDEQIKEATAQNDLIVTDETKANGLFTISDDLQGKLISALAAEGIDIKFEDLFDLSLLDEVYAENPDLI